MSYKYRRGAQSGGTPPRIRRDPLTKPLNFPPSPPGRDHLSREALAVEEALDELDKQLDYEDIHGPGTSQFPGAMWKYVPKNPPSETELDIQSQGDDEKGSISEGTEERVLEEVKRDLNYRARMDKYSSVNSDSSAGEEEVPTDFRSFVDITRRRDEREFEKPRENPKGVEVEEENPLDVTAFVTSRRGRRFKRNKEGQDELDQVVVDETSERLEELRKVRKSEAKENVFSSESEGQDSPKDYSVKIKTQEALSDPDLSHIDWLDALDAEHLPYEEYHARLDAKVKEFDADNRRLEEELRQLDIDQESEEKASKPSDKDPLSLEELGKFIEQYGRISNRGKYKSSKGKEKQDKEKEEEKEYSTRQKMDMETQREYDAAHWKNMAMMKKMGANVFGRTGQGGRKSVYFQPTAESDDGSADEHTGAGAGSSSRILPWASARKPTPETETSQQQQQQQQEQPQTQPPLRGKSLLEQMPGYGYPSPEDPDFIPKDAVRNWPFSFSRVVVNDPFFADRGLVEWTWWRVVIFIVTGMVLGALGAKVKRVTFDRWE